MKWTTVIQFVRLDDDTGEIHRIIPEGTIVVKTSKESKIVKHGTNKQGITTYTKFCRKPEYRQPTIFAND